MVTFLPDSSAQIGEQLAGVIESVKRRKNPNYEFQKAMQAHLATNPDAIKSLADLTKSAPPGFLENLGFGPLAKTIESVQESTASKIDRTTQGSQVRTAQAQAGSAEKSANIVQLLTEAADSELVKDPQLFQDSVLKILGMKTGAERRTATADASTAESTAQVKAGEALLSGPEGPQTEVLMLQAQRALQGEKWLETIPDIGEVDFMQIYADMEAGKPIDAKLLGAFTKQPGLMTGFEVAGEVYSMRKQLQEARIRAATSGGSGAVADRMLADDARTAWIKNDQVGSVRAWQQFLGGDPNISQTLEEIRAKPIEDRTSEERNLLAVSNRAGFAQAQTTREEYLEITNSISKKWTDIAEMQNNDKLKKSDQDVALRPLVSELNSLLDLRSQIPGARRLTAEYDPKKRRVEIRDNEGLMVTIPEVIAEPPPSRVSVQEGGTAVSPYNEIVTSIMEGTFSWEDYVRMEPDSEDTAAIHKELESKGYFKQRKDKAKEASRLENEIARLERNVGSKQNALRTVTNLRTKGAGYERTVMQMTEEIETINAELAAKKSRLAEIRGG